MGPWQDLSFVPLLTYRTLSLARYQDRRQKRCAMNARNKKYIVNAADFDKLLLELRGTRAKAKDGTQPRKAKSVPKSKPSVSEV